MLLARVMQRLLTNANWPGASGEGQKAGSSGKPLLPFVFCHLIFGNLVCLARGQYKAMNGLITAAKSMAIGAVHTIFLRGEETRHAETEGFLTD